MSLRQDIESLALSVGFDAVGLAPAHRPPSADFWHQWVAAGYAGDMSYMEREPERRADPRVYWPEVRTLLVCVKSYAPQPEDDPAPGPLEGEVARYARGEDYHEVLKSALHQLGGHLQRLIPGLNYRAVVDTAAVLERAHAVAAGLGWFGKNTLLLNRQRGSYTLLAVLLLDKELSPDNPSTAHCGSCTRCLDACPTGALTAPHVLDARLCLSYVNIELREDIPESLRGPLGPHLFGCDICQQVCPWVRKAGGIQNLGPFAPVGDRATPHLPTLLRLDAPQFATWARRSPMKRSKLRGIQRNAAVCLGNSPDREGAVAGLEPGLHNPDAMVRRHVAWGLGQQGGEKARNLLEKAHATEEDPTTLLYITRVLAGG